MPKQATCVDGAEKEGEAAATNTISLGQLARFGGLLLIKNRARKAT